MRLIIALAALSLLAISIPAKAGPNGRICSTQCNPGTNYCSTVCY